MPSAGIKQQYLDWNYRRLSHDWAKAINSSSDFTEKTDWPANVICGSNGRRRRQYLVKVHTTEYQNTTLRDKIFNHYNLTDFRAAEFTRIFLQIDLRRNIIQRYQRSYRFSLRKLRREAKPVKLSPGRPSNIGDRGINQTKAGKRQHKAVYLRSRYLFILITKSTIYLTSSFLPTTVCHSPFTTAIMEGLNKNWVSTNPGVNRIHFTNIKYGTYKLKVIVLVNDLNFQHRNHIYHRPPWYLSGWQSCYTSWLGIFMLYVAYIYVKNKIKLRNEELTKGNTEEINEAKLAVFHQYIARNSHAYESYNQSAGKTHTRREKIPKNSTQLKSCPRPGWILRLINQLMDIGKLIKGQMVIKFRRNRHGWLWWFDKDLWICNNKRNIKFGFIHDDNHRWPGLILAIWTRL